MKIVSKILSLMILSGVLLGCANEKKEVQNRYAVLIGEGPTVIEQIDEVDTLVIDAEYFSKDEIMQLKEQGVHEIYSYLNIGSLEKFRDYYDEYEPYALGAYENWPDEQWMDVSRAEWQELIASKVDELIDKGVDGFFMDNADVYELYPSQEAYDGIVRILRYVKSKDKNIMINGGYQFVKEYFESGEKSLFDGVNQESIYTEYDFIKNCCIKNDEENREFFTEYLDLVLENDCKAYVLEYATDPDIRKEANEYAFEHGYICYISENIELTLANVHH